VATRRNKARLTSALKDLRGKTFVSCVDTNWLPKEAAVICCLAVAE
jgi:hypothetical protein